MLGWCFDVDGVSASGLFGEQSVDAGSHEISVVFGYVGGAEGLLSFKREFTF